MFGKLFSGVLGGLIPAAGDYLKEREQRKAEVARLRHEIELEKTKGKIAYEIAKTQRAERSEGRDADWEKLSIENSGWLNDATWIVLSIPMVGVFIPPLQPYVATGFEHLANTPDWYRWLVVMIYAATFGIRVWRRKPT